MPKKRSNQGLKQKSMQKTFMKDSNSNNSNNSKDNDDDEELIVDFPKEIFDFVQKIGFEMSDELDKKLKILHDFIVNFTKNNCANVNLSENNLVDNVGSIEEMNKAREILKNKRSQVEKLSDSIALQLLSENLKSNSNAVKKEFNDQREKLLKILDEKLQLEMTISGLKLKYTILDNLIEVLK